MKLTRLHIKNFKSINDSGPFVIDERITCLVGKNESGKTAILQALTKVNAAEPQHASLDMLEYPRFASNEYKDRHESEPDEGVIASWVLSPDEHAAISKVIGPAAPGQFTTTKKYNNRTYYSGYDFDEASCVEHLIASCSLSDEEAEPVAECSTVQKLRGALAGIKEPAKRQKELLDQVAATFGENSGRDFVVNWLHARLPKVALFSEYVRMPGQLSLADLRTRLAHPERIRDTDRVFLALLNMVGRTPEELEKVTKFEELQAELEGVSNRLTREIFSYWSQNRQLKVQFRFEQGLAGDEAPFNQGLVLRTRIENTRHSVTTSFDQRSAGFVWFFSFLVWLHHIRKTHGDNFILLLDEPGLTLHARAQADLLRYFEEKLAPKHQLIYTTHSPFMVDSKHLFRARTVEDRWIDVKEDENPPDERELGTKVGDEILSTDRDTVFPLQAALGYELTQTLFVGEHTLLVEGPSDILYLRYFSEELRKLSRTALDARWTICPCGGIEKVGAFMSLFGGNKLHVAVLIDYAKGSKKKVDDLRRAKLLRDRHVLTAETYVGQSEADIEDLVGRGCYVALVNAAYGLSGAGTLPIPPPATPERIVLFVEEQAKTWQPSVAEYDHYHPAELLITDPKVGASLPERKEALDRFERLFSDLNALL